MPTIKVYTLQNLKFKNQTCICKEFWQGINYKDILVTINSTKKKYRKITESERGGGEEAIAFRTLGNNLWTWVSTKKKVQTFCTTVRVTDQWLKWWCNCNFFCSTANTNRKPLWLSEQSMNFNHASFFFSFNREMHISPYNQYRTKPKKPYSIWSTFLPSPCHGLWDLSFCLYAICSTLVPKVTSRERETSNKYQLFKEEWK